MLWKDTGIRVKGKLKTYSILRRGMVSMAFSIVSLEFTIMLWKLVRAVSVTTVRLFEDRGVSETVDRLCEYNGEV